MAAGRVAGQAVLASGSGDGSVRLWDVRTGRQLRVLKGHRAPVSAVAFTEIDGRTLLASGGADGTVRLWSAEDGRQLAVFPGHDSEVYSLAFGEVDGHLVLASGGGDRGILYCELLHHPDDRR